MHERLRSQAAVDVSPLHAREAAAEHLLAVLAAEDVVPLRCLPDERPQLREVPRAVRHGDQPASGTQDSEELGNGAVDVGHVIEHPGGNGRVERTVLERQRLDVAHDRLDASSARELDHTF
jgi:hypothetical protein